MDLLGLKKVKQFCVFERKKKNRRSVLKINDHIMPPNYKAIVNELKFFHATAHIVQVYNAM